MKNLPSICKTAAIVFVLVFNFACSPEEKKPNTSETQKNSRYSAIPSAVMNVIEEGAQKHFAGNENQKKIWINNQSEAWLRIEKYSPAIPQQTLKKIKDTSLEKYPDDICARENFILQQVSAAERIHAASIHTDAKFFEFAIKKAEEKYPDDYTAQDSIALSWIKFMRDIESKRPEFTPEDFERISEVSVNRSPDNPDEAYAIFSRHYDALMKINALNFGSDISHKDVEETKKKAIEEYPDDLIKRFDYLNKARRDLRAKKRGEVSNRRDEEIKIAAKEDKSKYLFENTVFLNVDDSKKAFPGALINLKSKKVIIAPREFLFDGLPKAFSAAFGNVKPSEVYAAKNLPVVLIVPESVNENMLLLKEAEVSYENQFFAVCRPRGISLQSFRMKVKSGDENFFEIVPVNERKTGNKYRTESTLIFDGDCGLLSLAVRIYNKAALEEELGKAMETSGSRNKFTGILRKAVAGDEPFASYKFARLSALENWEPVDAEKYAAQAKWLNEIDSENSDFSVFVTTGARNRQFNSAKIVELLDEYKKAVAEEFKAHGHNANLSEVHVKQLDDILAKMENFEELETAAKEFYSSFKNKIEYQIALRKAICAYLKKIREAKDIVHITGSF